MDSGQENWRRESGRKTDMTRTTDKQNGDDAETMDKTTWKAPPEGDGPVDGDSRIDNDGKKEDAEEREDAQGDMIKEVVGWVSIIGVIFIIISNKEEKYLNKCQNVDILVYRYICISSFTIKTFLAHLGRGGLLFCRW